MYKESPNSMGEFMEVLSQCLVETSLNPYGSSFVQMLIESSTKKERYLVSVAIFENLHILLSNKSGAEVLSTFCSKATYSEYKCAIKKLFDIKKLSHTVTSQSAINVFPELFVRLRPKYRNLYYDQISNYPQFNLLSDLLVGDLQNQQHKDSLSD